MRRLIRGLAISVAIAMVLVFLAGCPPPRRAETTRTFDGIQIQWCPPGTFAAGSPLTEAGHQSDEVLHEVTLTRGFWLSTFGIAQGSGNL